MSAKTSIQWTDRSWNPVRGCSIVSPGCTNCYAMKQAHRFSGKGQPYEGLTRMTARGPVWTGKIRFVSEALDEPLHWRKPQRVFVNSMSDLFHEDVPDEFIDEVFAVMALAPRHTFQVLTKRPERMLGYFAEIEGRAMAIGTSIGDFFDIRGMRSIGEPLINLAHGFDADSENWDEGQGDQRILPLANVHLCVSVENQATADERIPILLQTPAAVRFLSVEPLLERIDIEPWLPAAPHRRTGSQIVKRLERDVGCAAIDWVIVGGESGRNRRECKVEEIEDVARQCVAANVPVYVKRDSALRPGQEGRISDAIWALKDFPR